MAELLSLLLLQEHLWDSFNTKECFLVVIADSTWAKLRSKLYQHSLTKVTGIVPLASPAPVVGSRLWCLAEGAQLDKAKPQLSSGEATLFDLLSCLPWKRSSKRCWCARSRTWGDQLATILHVVSISWEGVCTRCAHSGRGTVSPCIWDQWQSIVA